MTRRVIATALAGLAGSAGMVFGLVRELNAAPAAVTIGAAAFTPKKLPANGGTVRIKSVRVTSRAGVTIFSVRARARLAGSATGGTTATLTSPLRNTWAGLIAINGNSTNTRANVDLFIEVDSSGGLFSKKIGRVQMDPQRGDSSQPPPPPPI